MNDHTRDTLKNIVKSFQNNGLQKLTSDTLGCAPDACIVPVKFSAERFDVVFLKDALVTPDTNLNEFQSRPMFTSAKKESEEKNPTRWGIALGEAPQGGIVPVCVSGVTVAKVYFKDETCFDDEFCSPGFTDTEDEVHLESAATGSAQILYKSDVKYVSAKGYESQNIYWCIIRIGNQVSGIIQVKLEETLHPWEKSGAHAVKASVLKPEVTRDSEGKITNISWKNTERKITVCSPFEHTDDPLEEGTRHHARWDSSVGAWVIILRGEGGSVEGRRMTVFGYALTGFSASSSGDGFRDEGSDGMPIRATEMGIGEYTNWVNTVAIQKESQAVAAEFIS